MDVVYSVLFFCVMVVLLRIFSTKHFFGDLKIPKLFKGNNIIKLILIILVILFGVYIWPTPYRYMSIGNNIPFRMNRITGIGEVWEGSEGWKKQ
jgi:hypothetical protein